MVAKHRGDNVDTVLVKGSSPKVRIIQLILVAILNDAADLIRGTGYVRDWVEGLPMRAMYTKVRAHSAHERPETAGWSLAAPVPACFPMDEEEGIAVPWLAVQKTVRDLYMEVASAENRYSTRTKMVSHPIPPLLLA